MSNELIRIIKREALQNAIDELESFTSKLVKDFGEDADPKDVVDKLKEIRKSI